MNETNLALRCSRRVALALGASCIALTPANAQQATDDETMDVIVVTAQKRRQNLEDVPISVTVFGDEEIDRANIDQLADYAVRTPNVNFVNRGNRSETRVSIRGISPVSTAGTANLTGIFIDEFNIAPNISTRTADPNLFDVEQIEVLKGPQGTFFGRNVVAGAISITSQKPSLDETVAELELEAASFDFYRATASGSTPLSQTLAVRALAYYDQNDGFLENVGGGPSNAEQNYGGRLAFVYEPTDVLSFDLSGYYSRNEQDLQTFVPSGFLASSVELLGNFTPPGTLPVAQVPFFPENAEQVSTDLGSNIENETMTVIGRMDYALAPDIDLTVVTGYIDNTFTSGGEGDFTSLPAFTIRRDEDVTAFSFETRLSGRTDRLDWLVGGIYAQDDVTGYQNSVQLEQNPLLEAYDTAFAFLGGALFGLVPGAPPPGAVEGFAFFTPGVDSSVGFFENLEFGFETTSYALFGETSYDLTDRLNVSLGARYSHDTIEGGRTELPLQPGLAPRQSLPSQEETFEDLAPRLAATYELSELTSLYGVVSKGYRTGGFNTTPGDPAFEAEDLWNYEVGLKGQAADGRLRYALAGFFMDWENTQVRAQDLVTQRQFVLNAEGSEHLGAEVEIGATLTEGLDVELSYGYVDAEFKDFPNARTLDGEPIDATGLPVPLAPQHTFSALAQYERPITPQIDGYVRGQYAYVDETREDVSLSDRRLNPSYELADFRVGLAAERWDLQAYVENAFDEEYRFGTNNLETYLSGAQVIVGMPRRYGVVLSVSY